MRWLPSRRVRRPDVAGAQFREPRSGADRERRDVDLAAIVLDRPDHGHGDVVRSAGADVRRKPDTRVVEHARLAYEAGEDDAHTDPGAVQIRPQRLPEAAQAELRRGVQRRAGRRRLAGDRRDEDQLPAAARRHAVEQQAGEYDRSTQVDGEGAVDLVNAELRQRPGGGQRGVGHERRRHPHKRSPAAALRRGLRGRPR